MKVEEDGRVFPTTDRAESIIAVLENEARNNNVKVYPSTQVLSIQPLHTNISSSSSHITTTNDPKKDPLFSVKFRKARARNVITTRSHIDKNDDYVLTDNDSNMDKGDDNNDKSNLEEYICDRVIFATGSNRGGYTMLEHLGHTISSPLPSLFSFKIKDDMLTSLSGLPVPKAQIKLILTKNDKLKCSSVIDGPGGKYIMSLLEQTGPVMITHQGLSGPGILRLSAYGAKILAILNYQLDIEINWLSDITVEDLTDHLNIQKQKNPNKFINTWFPPILLPIEDDLSTNLYNEEQSWSTVTDIIIASSSTTINNNGNINNHNNNNNNKNSNNDIKGNRDRLNKDTSNKVSKLVTPTAAGSGGGEWEPSLAPGEATIPRRLWKYILIKAGVEVESSSSTSTSTTTITTNNNNKDILLGKEQKVKTIPTTTTGTTSTYNKADSNKADSYNGSGLKWGSLSKVQIQSIVDQIMKHKLSVVGRYDD